MYRATWQWCMYEKKLPGIKKNQRGRQQSLTTVITNWIFLSCYRYGNLFLLGYHTFGGFWIFRTVVLKHSKSLSAAIIVVIVVSARGEKKTNDSQSEKCWKHDTAIYDDNLDKNNVYITSLLAWRAKAHRLLTQVWFPGHANNDLNFKEARYTKGSTMCVGDEYKNNEEKRIWEKHRSGIFYSGWHWSAGFWKLFFFFLLPFKSKHEWKSAAG